MSSPAIRTALFIRMVVLCFPFLAIAACGKSGPYDKFFTDKVDCTDLPPLPSEFVDAPSASKSLLSELGGGAARMVLRWDDADGEQSFLTAETTALVIRALDDVSWALRVDLPCTPDASAFVHFRPTDSMPAPLDAGEYGINAFGFDVPELEQGENEPDTNFDGTVTITSSANGEATGFMDGHARTTLKSHFTQEGLGIEVEVAALAFRSIRWSE